MSRKKQVNQKITALYCRISLEDGGDNESMSISNQKLILISGKLVTFGAIWCFGRKMATGDG